MIGIPALLAVSAWLEPDALTEIRAADWRGWAGVAYSGLIASLVGHGLLYWLVQRHPVSQVTPYLLIAPLIAVCLGVLVWGDRPGPKLIIGGAMVLGGVLLVALRALQKSRPTVIEET